jgi:FkbM family methyltransferase
MNFDDALKHYLPRVWFGVRFVKYKYLGRGEPELRLVRHFIAPGSTAIDVGSSIGLFSAEMARHAAKVLAFEPNPAIAAFTRRVAARNVEVVNVALSSKPGRATLSMPTNRRGHGVTELAGIGRAQTGESIAIDVETKRLDDFDVRDCSFIKIDVEGHEEEVLDGAAALIARERPALMIELVEAFNPGVVARVSARYAAMSYDGFFLSEGTLRPITEFDAARDQGTHDREYIANLMFIPAETQQRLRTVLTFANASGC